MLRLSLCCLKNQRNFTLRIPEGVITTILVSLTVLAGERCVKQSYSSSIFQCIFHSLSQTIAEKFNLDHHCSLSHDSGTRAYSIQLETGTIAYN